MKQNEIHIKDFVSRLFEDVEKGLNQIDMQMCKESDAHAKMELNINSQKVTVFIRKY